MTETSADGQDGVILLLTVTPSDDSTGGDQRWSIYRRPAGLFELVDERGSADSSNRRSANSRSICVGNWPTTWSELINRCLAADNRGPFDLATVENLHSMIDGVLFWGTGSEMLSSPGPDGRLLVLPHPVTAEPIPLLADEDEYDENCPVGEILLGYSWSDDDFLGTHAGYKLIDVGQQIAVLWPSHEAREWHDPRAVELRYPGVERAEVIAQICSYYLSNDVGLLASVIEPFDPERCLSVAAADEWKELLEDERWSLEVDVDAETMAALRANAVPPLIRRAFADPTSAAGLRLKKMLVDSTIHDLDSMVALSRPDIEPVDDVSPSSAGE